MQRTRWFAIYSTRRTPETTVRILTMAVYKALPDPVLRERFSGMGMEASGGGWKI